MLCFLPHFDVRLVNRMKGPSWECRRSDRMGSLRTTAAIAVATTLLTAVPVQAGAVQTGLSLGGMVDGFLDLIGLGGDAEAQASAGATAQAAAGPGDEDAAAHVEGAARAEIEAAVLDGVEISTNATGQAPLVELSARADAAVQVAARADQNLTIDLDEEADVTVESRSNVTFEDPDANGTIVLDADAGGSLTVGENGTVRIRMDAGDTLHIRSDAAVRVAADVHRHVEGEAFVRTTDTVDAFVEMRASAGALGLDASAWAEEASEFEASLRTRSAVTDDALFDADGSLALNVTADATTDLESDGDSSLATNTTVRSETDADGSVTVS